MHATTQTCHQQNKHGVDDWQCTIAAAQQIETTTSRDELSNNAKNNNDRYRTNKSRWNSQPRKCKMWNCDWMSLPKTVRLRPTKNNFNTWKSNLNTCNTKIQRKRYLSTDTENWNNDNAEFPTQTHESTLRNHEITDEKNDLAFMKSFKKSHQCEHNSYNNMIQLWTAGNWNKRQNRNMLQWHRKCTDIRNVKCDNTSVKEKTSAKHATTRMWSVPNGHGTTRNPTPLNWAETPKHGTTRKTPAIWSEPWNLRKTRHHAGTQNWSGTQKLRSYAPCTRIPTAPKLQSWGHHPMTPTLQPAPNDKLGTTRIGATPPIWEIWKLGTTRIHTTHPIWGDLKSGDNTEDFPAAQSIPGFENWNDTHSCHGSNLVRELQASGRCKVPQPRNCSGIWNLRRHLWHTVFSPCSLPGNWKLGTTRINGLPSMWSKIWKALTKGNRRDPNPGTSEKKDMLVSRVLTVSRMRECKTIAQKCPHLLRTSYTCPPIGKSGVKTEECATLHDKAVQGSWSELKGLVKKAMWTPCNGRWRSLMRPRSHHCKAVSCWCWWGWRW